MSEWQEFYNVIKDDSWPQCSSIEEFVTLPDNIQVEIVRDHLFRRNSTVESAPNYVGAIGELRALATDDDIISYQDALFLFTLIATNRPKNILEVGTKNGYCTGIIDMAVRSYDGGSLITVDTEDKIHPQLKESLQDSVSISVSDVGLLYSNETIGENAFDFIFINRDSEYSSVFRDLMKSYEKLKTNGLILCYHSDHHTTQSAIEDFLGVVFAVDCGEFGDKMRLFRKGEL